MLSPTQRYVVYALRTRPPVPLLAPWLACIRPAASVHPEPGSNSPSCILCLSTEVPNLISLHNLYLPDYLKFDIHSFKWYHLTLHFILATILSMNSLYLIRINNSLIALLILYVFYSVLTLRLGLQRYDQPILTTKFFRNFFLFFSEAHFV